MAQEKARSTRARKKSEGEAGAVPTATKTTTRKARKPGPSVQMWASECARTFSQDDDSAAISRAWWQGSATPSGATTR